VARRAEPEQQPQLRVFVLLRLLANSFLRTSGIDLKPVLHSTEPLITVDASGPHLLVAKNPLDLMNLNTLFDQETVLDLDSNLSTNKPRCVPQTIVCFSDGSKN